MSDDRQILWERFLNPEILRTNLIVASLYISAFEMLNKSIVERIKDFFTTGYYIDRPNIVDEKYHTKVLNRNSSVLYASLSWLRDMQVIDDHDLEKFEEVKVFRNELAHELCNFLSKGTSFNHLNLFNVMLELLEKIEKWWILNVEIATDPDLSAKEIDENGIIPGSIMSMRLLTDIALGTEEESKFYFDEFKKKN